MVEQTVNISRERNKICIFILHSFNNKILFYYYSVFTTPSVNSSSVRTSCLERLMPVCTNTTDLHKPLQHTRSSVLKHSLFSTTWIYWAVFKQKYDVRVIASAHTRFSFANKLQQTTCVSCTILYVTIIFTLITIVVHQIFRLLVWHWLLLSSREL